MLYSSICILFHFFDTNTLVGGAPSVAGVVGSAEYDAAMELEMWKLTEEENFQEQLKAREKTHMAKLGKIGQDEPSHLTVQSRLKWLR